MAKMMKTATALDRLANYASLSPRQKAALEKWLEENATDDAPEATPSRAPRIFGAAKEAAKTGKADRT